MKKSEREKLQKAKAAAKKAVEEKAAKKKTRGEVGEFGFGVNTIKHKFCASIASKPKTMKEVCAEEWNPEGRTHYGFFNELKKDKVVALNEDKKMYIIGSAADPANNKKPNSSKKKTAETKKAKK